MEAEVNIGEIDLFGAFSKISHESGGNAPSPPLQHKRNCSSNRKYKHKVDEDKDDDEDDNDDIDKNNNDGSGGGRGGLEGNG